MKALKLILLSLLILSSTANAAGLGELKALADKMKKSPEGDPDKSSSLRPAIQLKEEPFDKQCTFKINKTVIYADPNGTVTDYSKSGNEVGLGDTFMATKIITSNSQKFILGDIWDSKGAYLKNVYVINSDINCSSPEVVTTKPSATSSGNSLGLEAMTDKELNPYGGAGCYYDLQGKTYFADWGTPIGKVSGKLLEFTGGFGKPYISKDKKVKVEVMKNGNLSVTINGKKTTLKTTEACGD